MKIDINIVSVHGVSADRSGLRDFPEGISVTELVVMLDLPAEDVYAIMVDDRPVPPDDRDRRILVDGEKVTIFPPIQGG